MGFKRPIQTLLLGIALWICLGFGIGQNSTMAADLEIRSTPQTKIQTMSQTISNVESQVDRFLISIPSGYYTIANVEALKKQLKNPQTILVDVREPSEYQSGHIPNAINIPLRTLAQHQDNLDRDYPVVLYCSTGYRSAMGVMTLHLLGYDKAQGFPPSFAGWKAAGEAIAKS